MDLFSRRQYLRYGGVSMLAVMTGSGLAGKQIQGDAQNGSQQTNTTGTPESQQEQSGDSPAGGEQTACGQATLERDADGNIDFGLGPVSFESGTAGIELFRDRNPLVDIEIRDQTIDLTIVSVTDQLEVDITESNVDIEARGTRNSLERDGDEIEYESNEIDFEWTPAKLEVNRPVVIDFRNNEFEYRDSTLLFEWDAERQKFEYACRDI